MSDGVFFIKENNVITLGVPSNKISINEIAIARKIEGQGWRMIQDKDTIFVLGGDYHPLRCLRLKQNGGRRAFNGIEKAEMKNPRSNHAVCLAAHDGRKFLYVTGADQKFGIKSSKGTERYDIARECWEKMPNLLRVRQSHASCAHGDSIYVFCGLSNIWWTPDFIERLDTKRLSDGWQEISI